MAHISNSSQVRWRGKFSEDAAGEMYMYLRGNSITDISDLYYRY